MDNYEAICNDFDELYHYGVIGMRWGVRRYQPYSQVPRGSGKGGKEIGNAKKIQKENRKIARENIRTAYKKAQLTSKDESK